MASECIILEDMWYVAFHSTQLKAKKLTAKAIAGHQLVFGRDSQNKPFALKDNCPHRGIPLSCGWYKNDTIQCCYHGWEFDTQGICKNIPALALDNNIQVNKIRVPHYPCKEENGVIWVYISSKKIASNTIIPPVPDLIIKEGFEFKHVETVQLPANIDHSVIGLIDPAHVTFVHQSWFWRSKKSLRIKEKHFEPTALGFKMSRHAPSSNSKGYKAIKGKTSTEITFEIPGIRKEHILVGDKKEIISISTLTPLSENLTELNQFFYSNLAITNLLWYPLKKFGKIFIGQDLAVFQKLSKGLQSNPNLMLVGEPDTQARWYYELKRQWIKSKANNEPFQNHLPPATLHWVT